MVRRSPALYPLDASSRQLRPSPSSSSARTTRASLDAARRPLGAMVEPACQPLPWVRSCSGLRLPGLTCSHLRFFRAKLFLTSVPLHIVFSLPEVLFPLCMQAAAALGFLFVLDFSFQRSSHNLSLSISETCFFHRTEHNLIFLCVYLEVFFPYLTVNPWRTESVFSLLFSSHLISTCHSGLVNL